jgi:hypothetical protein
MCSVASGCKGQKFMEREDPWCKTADLGKPGYTIGNLTNVNGIKRTCVCLMKVLQDKTSACRLKFTEHQSKNMMKMYLKTRSEIKEISIDITCCPMQLILHTSQ